MTNILLLSSLISLMSMSLEGVSSTRTNCVTVTLEADGFIVFLR